MCWSQAYFCGLLRGSFVDLYFVTMGSVACRRAIQARRQQNWATAACRILHADFSLEIPNDDLYNYSCS